MSVKEEKINKALTKLKPGAGFALFETVKWTSAVVFIWQYVFCLCAEKNQATS